ncbi:uncharacterized protein LOC118469385 isoform X2 [Amphiprion ocellaris]|uniref:uncharacterized protein LOC118469385 isoform X2 n=1 Tax=Amphiprion ocellaris TaxID=80972 RepID=UPI001649D038|nr:uncharacterized protein LOC118469385 isoform X2 [Amphiprion ocellaris]
MAMFGKVLEPVGYMQTVRVLVQGICSYLGGSSTSEEAEGAKKNLDHMDQELGASGGGLLEDPEVHQLEDDLTVVYYQLGTAINFVLGTGLLCLFTQASLTGRDQALLMKTWSDRMGALYRKMKTSGGRCLGYFLEQAEDDIRQQLQEAVQRRAPPEEAAGDILKTLEKNYDWLRWAVMLHPAVGRMEDDKDEETQEGEKEKEPTEDQSNNLLSVASEAPIPHVMACYRDAPTSLDKSRIHQLIQDLEWKIPNPPPEVYASIEEDPGRARRYLASRMLKKLQEGLGSGVAVHVVPGRMEMKCNFPPASYYLYEYKHRLASGTVCVFG